MEKKTQKLANEEDLSQMMGDLKSRKIMVQCKEAHGQSSEDWEWDILYIFYSITLESKSHEIL